MSYDILGTRSIDRVQSAFNQVDMRIIEKHRYEPEKLREVIDGARGLFVHSENDYDGALIK